MRRKAEFYSFLRNVANYYGTDVDALIRGESFALEVPKAAELGENIQQRSEFLKSINLDYVTDVSGYKLRGATEKSITGRKKDGRYLARLDHTQGKYQLTETDSGIIVPWAMFDNFARFGDRLAALYAEFVQTQIALDQLKVGWYGKSVAENTSAADMSDVNKGWMQLEREEKPENVMKDGATVGKIKIFGEGADFENLDHLAAELKSGIDLRHRDRNDLVFLVGADLIGKEAELINKAHGLTPTEKAVLGSQNLLGSFGGMRGIVPPNFPARGAVVTTLSNLSIYVQDASVRRSYRNDEDRKGIIDSYYRNEGYVVEDAGLFTAIEFENVKLPGEDD
ncbi:phage major capsid protein, P2 family [Gallibacterium anatis]|uniref:Phage major capsid protein, P2 family n=2 Tax=Gallibacterium anatis TaxID=750 RepID=F4HA06_GALAU|nr:phage major capsid protein, P2 family [Gallibacterium anatis]AEC18493.1 Phage major capsid protein, P2 family [Gallibacterium anatis UMN179]MDK9430969.1 phage major capsid protein, P2 family [Gallibacterium anatis]WIM80544.1 phage major capsid protein, P2 family [Gallibacterium anatis]